MNESNLKWDRVSRYPQQDGSYLISGVRSDGVGFYCQAYFYDTRICEEGIWKAMQGNLDMYLRAPARQQWEAALKQMK
jgi:hypothetical protein